MEKNDQDVFAIINSIPWNYHSCDLRNFFSQFIESKGFECFHFKHRPESHEAKVESAEFFTSSLKNVESTSQHCSVHGKNMDKTKRSTCCIVKLSQCKYEELRKMYNKRHWLDRRGDSIAALCNINKLKVAKDDLKKQKYITRREQKQFLKEKELFSQDDLEKLPELHPPFDVMPNGNVGTPTSIFLQLIQQCKLPPGVIKKLGLTFPKTRSNRRYGNVPLDYGTIFKERKRTENPLVTVTNAESLDLPCEVTSGKGHHIELENTSHQEDADGLKEKYTTEEQSSTHDSEESAEDNDDCEEWERHEALQDDPTNVERNKERLFEEEIELKWEKGGSGLVFYTDAQYWKEQEGDFDEQTADDWDVDMSVYYEENGGDKDARDYVSIRQEQRRRAGLEATDMRTAGFMREKKGGAGGWSGWSGDKDQKIGTFEKHTKGIGRKVLKRHGWSEGEGLGSTIRGIAEALDNEGQVPSDKRGIGYYGEKLDRFDSSESSNKKPKTDYIISTIYDNPEETDPVEPLLRRHHHYHITYRHGVQFKKAEDPD